MAEAGFFFNTTTQRPDRSLRPSPLTNISFDSQAQPLKPLFKKKSTNSRPGHRSSESTDGSSRNSSSRLNFTTDLDHAESDHMLSTPLPDYKHSANQTKQARAQAQARKNSTTSGSSADRKNAIQAAEARAAASAAMKGEVPGRSSSISSHTGSSGLTTVISSEPPPTDALLRQPFSRRNGKRYLRDNTLPYPLPCDLSELHRQTLRTMLLCQVFNGVVCSPAFRNKPPKRVLEIGCGTGFWSVMCHKHFSRQGFPSVTFTGIDIAPLSPQPDPEEDMDWRFVQHDLRRVPFPFRDGEFNLIMVKDMSLVTPTTDMQKMMDEYLRILKPGGTLEIWDGDHSLRMLLPHNPPSAADDSDEEEDEDQLAANAIGTYTLTQQTPLAPPQNQYLVDFNAWIAKALEPRRLSPMPCTTIRPMLVQESEMLEDIDSRRLAIPLGEVRWEREGVGGNIVQGANGQPSSKGKESERKLLSPSQAALRHTALTTVVQMIESLEPLLREASGKGQDEWDRWQGSMMTDLLQNNGTSWGECLEVGAWWARKKVPPG